MTVSMVSEDTTQTLIDTFLESEERLKVARLTSGRTAPQEALKLIEKNASGEIKDIGVILDKSGR